LTIKSLFLWKIILEIKRNDYNQLDDEWLEDTIKVNINNYNR
jgi:hypothetical protein